MKIVHEDCIYLNCRRIGNNATIYQGVVLGANGGSANIPTFGNNVTICVGANVFVNHDIEENGVVGGVPARPIKKEDESMQALLITAYKSTEQLTRLIEETHKNFLLFVHVDKKTNSIDMEKIKNRNYSNLNLISKYKINWGGVNHLLAILDLLKLAVNDSRVTYIHIISGQDIPVRSYTEFDKFFTNSDAIYMTCTPVQNSPDEIKRRLENWIPFSNTDSRKRVVRCVNDLFYSCQKRMNLLRSKLGSFEKVYKGMVWCSFPIKTGRYIIEYNESHGEFIRQLMHTLVPEEFFFQTIVMNSPFQVDVIFRNLRYTDWSGKNGSRPSFLDETDYAAIMQSGDFFARKIDLQISNKLLNEIIERSKP